MLSSSAGTRTAAPKRRHDRVASWNRQKVLDWLHVPDLAQSRVSQKTQKDTRVRSLAFNRTPSCFRERTTRRTQQSKSVWRTTRRRTPVAIHVERKTASRPECDGAGVSVVPRSIPFSRFTMIMLFSEKPRAASALISLSLERRSECGLYKGVTIAAGARAGASSILLGVVGSGTLDGSAWPIRDSKVKKATRELALDLERKEASGVR